MKNLKNHTLFYDKDCPMCSVYSSAFIRCGMLEKNGRENFSNMSEDNVLIIDYERAKNEIALISHNNNEVAYGLDSLLLIIGHSLPLLEKVGRLKPIYWFFKKMYSLVSYNRKVIVPSGKIVTEKSCVPTFNLKYRIFYLLFTVLLSSFIFNDFLQQFISGDLIFEKTVLMVVALLFWQSLSVRKLAKEKFFDYLGNLVTVILIASLFTISVLFFKITILLAYFFSTFLLFFIFFEHLRRSKLLKAGFLPSIFLILFGVISSLLYYFFN